MPNKKQKHGGKKRQVLPLEEFFAQYYPRFKHNSARSASHEFYRFCDESGWSKGDPKRDKAHCDFKNALVRQFNHIYGTNKDSFANWKNLCYIVRIDPIPEDLETCREAVRRTHVNLVDLVDTETTGEDVEVFDTELELSKYTKSEGKFFPREEAYAGGLLRYLLRHIFHPSIERSSRR